MNFCKICKKEIVETFHNATKDLCGRASCGRKAESLERIKKRLVLNSECRNEKQIPQECHLTNDGYIATRTWMRKQVQQ